MKTDKEILQDTIIAEERNIQQLESDGLDSTAAQENLQRLKEILESYDKE